MNHPCRHLLIVFCWPILAYGQISPQLTPFQVGDSAIGMMVEGRYEEGIRFIEQLPRAAIDAGDWIVVAQYEFLNNDTTRLFELLEFLCREYGFRLTEQHTGLAYYESLTTGKYATRFKEIQDRSLPGFLAKRKQGMERIRQLEEMRVRDQLRGEVNTALMPLDSCFWPSSRKVIAHLDNVNFQQLMHLCIHGGFPNNFDLQFNSTSTAYLILWHNCSDSVSFNEKWARIWPYLDEAYALGKINNAFVITYDYFLARYSGHQLYGTVPGAPIKDEEGLAERRAKYGLSH